MLTRPKISTTTNIEEIIENKSKFFIRMPEVRIQRLSATRSQQLSGSQIAESNGVEQVVSTETRTKRSKSKDAAKSTKISKKKSLSPEKTTRRSRTKSKSPSRSASRSRKEGKDAKSRRTASPKPTKGAKLYTKKDLVQEIAPEIPQKRVLRSSSTMSSKSDLKATMNTETIPEQTIESIAPKLNDSEVKDVEPAKKDCSKVFIDLGYMRVGKCVLMKIVFFSFILMLALSLINYYDSNKEYYNEKFGVYINSFNQCIDNSKRKLQEFKTKFF